MVHFIYINEVGGKMITGFVSLLILIGLTIYAQKAHTKIELTKNGSDNLLTIKKYNLFCCEKYSACICLENVLIDCFSRKKSKSTVNYLFIINTFKNIC